MMNQNRNSEGSSAKCPAPFCLAIQKRMARQEEARLVFCFYGLVYNIKV